MKFELTKESDESWSLHFYLSFIALKSSSTLLRVNKVQNWLRASMQMRFKLRTQKARKVVIKDFVERKKVTENQWWGIEQFLAPRKLPNMTDDELRTRHKCNKSTMFSGANTSTALLLHLFFDTEKYWRAINHFHISYWSISVGFPPMKNRKMSNKFGSGWKQNKNVLIAKCVKTLRNSDKNWWEKLFQSFSELLNISGKIWTDNWAKKKHL